MTQDPGTVEVEGAQAQVRFERMLGAPVERVWQALTEEDQLARWLTAGTFEAGEAGTLVFDFGEGGTVGGRILTWEPPRRLSYTWLIPDEPPSIVEWTLQPVGTSTRLRLTHSTLPERMARGYAAGWHAYLERLEALASGDRVPGFEGRFETLLEVYTR